MKPTAPIVVAMLRGVLEAAVITAIGLVVDWVTTADLGAHAAWVPVIVLAARTAEGVADQRIDPTKQRGALGGKPAP